MNYILMQLLKNIPLVVFLSIVMLTPTVPVNGQTFDLHGNRYQKVKGTWYTIIEGKMADPIISDRIIVRMHGGQNVRKIDFNQLNLEEIEILRSKSFGGFYTLHVDSSLDPFAVAKKLESSMYFDYIGFDVAGVLQRTPNDQYYQNQWNLPKISLPSAWDTNTGSSSIPIAIIDTGVDYNHEDLDGNVWSNSAEINGQSGIDDDNNNYVDDYYGWNFWNGNNDPFDLYGHGTSVAGIAAAQMNNFESSLYLGVAGIAGGWNSVGSKIMSLRVTDAVGNVSASAVAYSITYAAKNGAKVINLSLGLAGDYPYVKSAVDTATSSPFHCVIVASAGNYNTDIVYPARYSNTIAVGATVENDTRWGSSCFGPQLDVMAPGGADIIWSTDITGSGGYSSGNYTSSFGGTSASAPHVSGLAALILSNTPSLPSWTAVRDIIRASTDKVSGMGGADFTEYYGYGRINADKALKTPYVPYTHNTIQTAINSVPSEYTVLVASGTYGEDITMKSGVNVIGVGSVNIAGSVTFNGATNCELRGVYVYNYSPATTTITINNGSASTTKLVNVRSRNRIAINNGGAYLSNVNCYQYDYNYGIDMYNAGPAIAGLTSTT